MPLFYAVVGASRGIGLEYIHQLARRPDTVVFAIVRNPEGSVYLQAAAASLNNIHIISGDVADYNSLEASRVPKAKQVSEISGGKLDCLIHNAANMDTNTVFKGFDDFANMEELDNAFISAYKVNSLGPVHSIIAFLPLLRASNTKKIVVIGSCGGDIKTILTLGIANTCAYAMSKAATAVAATKFGLQLKDEGFVTVTLDPGIVNISATAPDRDALKRFRTSMKEPRVELVIQTPEESVSAQLKVIDGLLPSHNGLYLSHTGGEYRAPSWS